MKYVREIFIWVVGWGIGAFLKLSAADAAGLATFITAVVWLAFLGIKYFTELEAWQKTVNKHIEQHGEVSQKTFSEQNMSNTQSNSNSSTAGSTFITIGSDYPISSINVTGDSNSRIVDDYESNKE